MRNKCYEVKNQDLRNEKLTINEFYKLNKSLKLEWFSGMVNGLIKINIVALQGVKK